MREFVLIFTLLMATHGVAGVKLDCERIRKEAVIFQQLAPSGLAIYRDQLASCQIYQINGLSLNDYFQTEHDSLLALSYIAIDQQLTHPRLLDYMIVKERWDLLLLTLDTLRNYEKANQIKAINHLFYKPLPHYFNVELKEMFNFFSAPEKIALSQQLIPSNPQEVKHLNKRNNYIYEFWPLFDQMVFINHLRELYPYQFEKLSVFWREKLVSYYYDGIENQDPSFKLLSHLLTRDVLDAPVEGANQSLQLFYYIKMGLFNQASEFIQNNEKSIFFNVLRYFELFDSTQQNYLMKVPVQFSISDIKRLFDAYYFQLDHPGFRQWVWQVAANNGFDCEQYLDDPFVYLQDLPFDYNRYLATLGPITNEVKKGAGKLNQYYLNDPTNTTFSKALDKKEIAFIARFYNSFNKVPFKDQKKVLTSILPFITISSHQQYLDLLPYLTTTQKIELIDRFHLLEEIPTQNRAEWSRWVQPNLKRIDDKKKLNSPPKEITQKETLPLSSK